MTNPTHVKLTDSKILKLNIESIKKIFYIALFYFLAACIFEFWKVWEGSFIVIPFIGFSSSLEIVFRDKNVLHKIKQDSRRNLSYYLLSLILVFFTVALITFFFYSTGLNKLHYYRHLLASIISFTPVFLSFIGYKLGKV